MAKQSSSDLHVPVGGTITLAEYHRLRDEPEPVHVVLVELRGFLDE